MEEGINYYEEDEVGCCLNCDYEDVEGWNGIEGDGCLCFSCKCRKCEMYNDGRCELAREWSSTNLNLLVQIRVDGWIYVEVDGPIDKSDYSKVRPFLKENFRFNWENKRYEVYSTNPRFVNALVKILRDNHFSNICFLSTEKR